MQTLLVFLIILLSVNLDFVLSEYCYYREGKEGKPNYLDCEVFDDHPIEGISLIHLKHNTTIPVIGKSLLSPFKNLKTLYITASNVEAIEPGALHNYKLEMVDFYHNNLKTIGNGTFSSQNVLKVLDLSYNKFESLEDNEFADLISLKWLSLTSNEIATIKKEAFNNLRNLKALFLGFNRIQKLEIDTFEKVTSLEHLDLSFNSLTSVQLGSFSNQIHLKNLDLQHNYLESLADHIFDSMSSLAILDISQNRIKELQSNLFYETNELQILKFSNNQISQFNATELLAHAPKLQEIHLNQNQWKCDNLKEMLKDFKEKNVFIATASDVLSSEVDGIRCHK